LYPPSSASLWVVCLCADWCGVCREYLDRFNQVKALIQVDDPHAKFLWIDVEDDADLLHPMDVDDFPTLLIAMGDNPHFFGPLIPQAQTLERMIRTALKASANEGLADPNLRALVGRIQTEKTDP
jgi:hypothetical protein